MLVVLGGVVRGVVVFSCCLAYLGVVVGYVVEVGCGCCVFVVLVGAFAVRVLAVGVFVVGVLVSWAVGLWLVVGVLVKDLLFVVVCVL